MFLMPTSSLINVAVIVQLGSTYPEILLSVGRMKIGVIVIEVCPFPPFWEESFHSA